MMKEVTWNEIDNHCRELADKIVSSGKKYDVIVGVGRGGLIPAVILSHQLGVPLIPINWQLRDSDTADYHMDNYALLKKVVGNSKNLLLVDDINDTGKTMNDIKYQINLKMLEDGNRRDFNMDTATLYQKTKTSHGPNSFCELVDDSVWVVFPWEQE